MKISPYHPPLRAGDLPLERLADHPQLAENHKVSELSRQFEALLLRQILNETRKTAIHSSTELGATARGIYDDLINQQLADSISRSGSFGLARDLHAQLAHQLAPATPTNPAAPTSGPANFTHRKADHE